MSADTPAWMKQFLEDEENGNTQDADSALALALAEAQAAEDADDGGYGKPAELSPDEQKLLDLYIHARTELIRNVDVAKASDLCWIAERAQRLQKQLTDALAEIERLRTNADMMRTALSDSEKAMNDLRRAAFEATGGLEGRR